MGQYESTIGCVCMGQLVTRPKRRHPNCSPEEEQAVFAAMKGEWDISVNLLGVSVRDSALCTLSSKSI